jgi:hypothetical protein
MREPPSAFVTSCGNRLTSFFGGFASPICRLRMADGGQIRALALVGRPGMAGGGSDRGSSNRLPSCDGRCRPSGAATAYVPPRAPCPASRSTHQPGRRVRFSMKNR